MQQVWFGEDNLVAQALKNFDGGACYAGVRAVNVHVEECNAHDIDPFLCVQVSQSPPASGAGHNPNEFGLPSSAVLSREAGPVPAIVRAQVEVGCSGTRNRGDVFYLSSRLTPLDAFL